MKQAEDAVLLSLRDWKRKCVTKVLSENVQNVFINVEAQEITMSEKKPKDKQFDVYLRIMQVLYALSAVYVLLAIVKGFPMIVVAYFLLIVSVINFVSAFYFKRAIIKFGTTKKDYVMGAFQTFFITAGLGLFFLKLTRTIEVGILPYVFFALSFVIPLLIWFVQYKVMGKK